MIDNFVQVAWASLPVRLSRDAGRVPLATIQNVLLMRRAVPVDPPATRAARSRSEVKSGDVRRRSLGCVVLVAAGALASTASSSSMAGADALRRVAEEAPKLAAGTHPMRIEDLVATLSRPTVFWVRISEIETELRRGCSLTGKDGGDAEYRSQSYSCAGDGLKSASLIVWKGRNAERLQELVLEFEPSRYEAVLQVVARQLGSPSEANGEAAFWRSFSAKHLPASDAQPVISVQGPMEGHGNAVFSVAFEISEP